MSCVELYAKPNFGRRIRRVDCATAAAGWPKIGPHFYNSIGGAAAPIAPGAVAPTVGGVPGQTPTVQIQTHGAGLSANATATVVFSIDGAADVTATVALTAGDDGHAMVVKIAAAPEWAANTVTATASGARLDLDAGAGKQITKLTVTVS